MVKRKKNRLIMSNRFLYTLIAIGIVALVGVGVYAFGAVPNPGHSVANLQTCDSDGQILKMSGGAWVCAADAGGAGLWIADGSDIYYDSGNVQIREGMDFILRAGSYIESNLIFEDSLGFQKGKIWTNPDPTPGLYFSSGDSTPDLTIDDFGNIGIGTNNPNSRLTISGNLNISGTLITNLLRINQNVISLSQPSQAGYLPINLAGTIYYVPIYTELASSPPGAPSNLQASQNYLYWNDNSNNEDRFEVERKLDSASTYNLVATLPVNTREYTDTSVQVGNTYNYRIRACNIAGCSAYSNVVTTTILSD